MLRFPRIYEQCEHILLRRRKLPRQSFCMVLAKPLSTTTARIMNSKPRLSPGLAYFIRSLIWQPLWLLRNHMSPFSSTPRTSSGLPWPSSVISIIPISSPPRTSGGLTCCPHLLISTIPISSSLCNFQIVVDKNKLRWQTSTHSIVPSIFLPASPQSEASRPLFLRCRRFLAS